MILPLWLECVLFLFLAWLLWPSTFYTMLNISSKVGFLVLFLILEINEIVILAGLISGLSFMSCVMLRCILCIPTFLRIFLMNGCWILLVLFLDLLRWPYDFYPSFLSLQCICRCWNCWWKFLDNLQPKLPVNHPYPLF